MIASTSVHISVYFINAEIRTGFGLVIELGSGLWLVLGLDMGSG